MSQVTKSRHDNLKYILAVAKFAGDKVLDDIAKMLHKAHVESKANNAANNVDGDMNDSDASSVQQEPREQNKPRIPFKPRNLRQGNVVSSNVQESEPQ